MSRCPESIETAWRSYQREVIPAGAHRTQVVECRRAFYAGAWAAWQAVRRTSDDDVAEEECMEWLAALERELLDFKARVGKDR